jgi:alpha-1,3-rhamnosyl/mannosyltransferase
VTGPHRVGVNLLWLVPGVVGGSEEYTVRTLDGILDVAPPDVDLVLFALRPFIEAHPELTDRIETVTLSLTGRDKSVRVAAESSPHGSGPRAACRRCVRRVPLPARLR